MIHVGGVGLLMVISKKVTVIQMMFGIGVIISLSLKEVYLLSFYFVTLFTQSLKFAEALNLDLHSL